MKKSNLLWLALPLVVSACSSDDLLDQPSVNDRFAGIEKVDAKFNFVEEGQGTRMATKFGLEAGDKVGLAWMQDKIGGGGIIARDGQAYQNHPLYVNNGMLTPITSIYVGEYFSYLPYDATTVEPGKINFSLAEQPLASTMAEAAPASIWISAKETEVTKAGTPNAVTGDIEDKAGIDGIFNIYPRQFSNLIKLDLTYNNNQPEAKYDLEPAEIYSIEVSINETLTGTTISTANGFNAFTYAPTSEVSDLTSYSWEGKETPLSVENQINGAYKLENENPVSTKDAKAAGFYFNAMPTPAADATATSNVVLKVTSDYGVVYIAKPVNEVLFTAYKNAAEKVVFGSDADGNTVTDPKYSVAIDKSAINTLGNIAKVVTTVDFKDAVMNGMHVKNDAMLQKLLKFYKYKVDKGATPETVTFYLDGKGDNKEFEMSSASAKLLQDINGNTEAGIKINLVKCTEPSEKCESLVLKNNGTAENLPVLNFIKAPGYGIILRGNWNMGTSVTTAENAAFTYTNVTYFDNEGIVNFTATKVDNAALLTTDFYNMSVVYVANDVAAAVDFANMYNYGTVTIPETSELLVNNNFYNEAVGLGEREQGVINNKGVFATVLAEGGKIYNYGIIDRRGSKSAKTYITSNTYSGNFANNFENDVNEMGTIILADKDDDNYSISNSASEGFIKLYVSGADVTVDDFGTEANYIVLDNKTADKTTLDFTYRGSDPNRINYVEFAQKGECTWTSSADKNTGNIKGLIVNAGSKVTIKKNNRVNAANAYVKGIIYLGGYLTQYGLSDGVAATKVMSGTPAVDFKTYLGGEEGDASNVRKF